MIDKRRLPRKRPEVALPVSDAMTGEIIGRLGDVSMDGMLLIAHRPIVSDALYQLQFDLQVLDRRLPRVEIGVHETWCEETTVPGQSWVGFRFIDIAPETERALQDWLGEYDDSAS